MDINEKLMQVTIAGTNADLVSLLSHPGCDPRVKGSNGETALMRAASRGSENRVRLLLPVSEALAADDGGMTALMWAARFGREACVGLLLPVSDAMSKAGRGVTALMWAARYGHEGCVRLLLPASDALARDINDWTASSWAREEGWEILSKFIDGYVLAQSEEASIASALLSVDVRGRNAPRI